MSLSPQMIDAMLSAGCSAEQIAAVVKAALVEEEQKKAEKRAKDAERQRRHRASRDVTVTERDQRDAPLNGPLSPCTPYPPYNPPSSTPAAHDAAPAVERVKRFQTDFEFPGFWGAYPNKTKRASAMTAWFHARQKADAEAIIAGAKRYADHLRTATDPPLPMNPDNWLDAERWTDEPLETSRNARHDAPRQHPGRQPGNRTGTQAEHRSTIAVVAERMESLRAAAG